MKCPLTGESASNGFTSGLRLSEFTVKLQQTQKRSGSDREKFTFSQGSRPGRARGLDLTSPKAGPVRRLWPLQRVLLCMGQSGHQHVQSIVSGAEARPGGGTAPSAPSVPERELGPVPTVAAGAAEGGEWGRVARRRLTEFL